MKKVTIALVALFILVSLTVAGYGYDKYVDMTEKWYEPLQEQTSQEQFRDEEVQNENKENTRIDQSKKPEQEEKVTLDAFNVLLLGVDQREGESVARSDTIILASVNPRLQKLLLLSIPRDTLAEIPGRGQDKFNHSMFYGGTVLVKKTMEQFFDIEVHRYVSVDFEGFTKMIDTLGGIEIEVKRRMKYSDPSDGTNIDLKPGLQVLSGKEALDYARFRLSDIGSDASDFERMQRQQEVIRKAMDKATNLTSVFKSFVLMDILGDHIKTNLKEEEIRKLAVLFKDFSSSNVNTAEMKGTNQRMRMHGYNLWFYKVDPEERQRIRKLIEENLSE